MELHREPHLPTPPRAPGRPRLHTLREVLDAIFYILRSSGCAWRLLPNDFPPWKTIHHSFRTWRLDGTFERMHAALRKRSRVRMDRDPEPSALGGGQPVGEDDRRRRRATWLRRRKEGQRKEAAPVGGHTGPGAQSPAVHSANIQDRQGIKLLLEPANTGLTRLSHLWLDAGYTGQDKGAGWVQRALGWSAEIVRHPPKPAPEEVMM
jgi:putative transposase